jgi:hypothetical protein
MSSIPCKLKQTELQKLCKALGCQVEQLFLSPQLPSVSTINADEFVGVAVAYIK